MTCFWLHPNDANVSIPAVEEIDGVTFYLIEIRINTVSWYIKHRYRDFHDLHQQLVTDHGVSKDILPPKRVIKNKCPVFIEKRRKGLELYLKNVFNYLQRTMPRIFLQFLDFHLYDIFFLLQNLAFQFYLEGDTVLESTKHYTFNVLELHSISKCLKGPYPAIEETDRRYDLSHVFDLCSQLHHLKVQGLSEPYKNSNIVPNDLSYDLTCFKVLINNCTAVSTIICMFSNIVTCTTNDDQSLQTLEMVGVDTMGKIYSVGNLRESVRKLKVNHTLTTNVSQVLLCDAVHKAATTDKQVWRGIEELDLSYNTITDIDAAIRLVPNVHTLILTQNKISDISTNLSSLAHLSNLILSNNIITSCESLHTKLGNVVTIDLSQNTITTLRGFERLYSLENLDISCNRISDIEDIRYVAGLPCLEHLCLTGNPVAITVDYRVKVFEHFGSRAVDLYLDNEKPTQKEMDTAFILQALRIVKEGKTPNLTTDKLL